MQEPHKRQKIISSACRFQWRRRGNDHYNLTHHFRRSMAIDGAVYSTCGTKYALLGLVRAYS